MVNTVDMSQPGLFFQSRVTGSPLRDSELIELQRTCVSISKLTIQLAPTILFLFLSAKCHMVLWEKVSYLSHSNKILKAVSFYAVPVSTSWFHVLVGDIGKSDAGEHGIVVRIEPSGCALDANRKGIACTQAPVIELRDKGGNVVSAADRTVLFWACTRHLICVPRIRAREHVCRFFLRGSVQLVFLSSITILFRKTYACCAF